MKRQPLILLLASLPSFAQEDIPRNSIQYAYLLDAKSDYLHAASQQFDCRRSWQQFSLGIGVKGIVVYHATAEFLCGLEPTASVTLVKTATNDTIRVLWLCNTNKEFDIGQSVVVKPSTGFSSITDTSVPNDPRTCTLKKTCFGTIESVFK